MENEILKALEDLIDIVKFGILMMICNFILLIGVSGKKK